MPEAAPVAELSDHLGFWLRYVSNAVSHAFAVKLAGQGVTVAEWAVMRCLYARPPMAPSQLARDLGMTRGTITKLANRLITKSLLVRTESQTDGRTQTLALTDQGQALVPALAALADQNDAEFFSHLAAAERQTLRDLLERLVARHQLATVPIK